MSFDLTRRQVMGYNIEAFRQVAQSFSSEKQHGYLCLDKASNTLTYKQVSGQVASSIINAKKAALSRSAIVTIARKILSDYQAAKQARAKDVRRPTYSILDLHHVSLALTAIDDVVERRLSTWAMICRAIYKLFCCGRPYRSSMQAVIQRLDREINQFCTSKNVRLVGDLKRSHEILNGMPNFSCIISHYPSMHNQYSLMQKISDRENIELSIGGDRFEETINQLTDSAGR